MPDVALLSTGGGIYAIIRVSLLHSPSNTWNLFILFYYSLNTWDHNSVTYVL
jgi:hypothetical protein